MSEDRRLTLAWAWVAIMMVDLLAIALTLAAR